MLADRTAYSTAIRAAKNSLCDFYINCDRSISVRYLNKNVGIGVVITAKPGTATGPGVQELLASC